MFDKPPIVDGNCEYFWGEGGSFSFSSTWYDGDKGDEQEERPVKQNEKPGDYDSINPSHYKFFPKEVYEIMIFVWGVEKYVAFCEMNAFKYRMRAGTKPGQPAERDLEKAKWYEDMAKKLKQ
jgi:hypothetical protein